jgi:type I restriction enzyme S subunit
MNTLTYEWKSVKLKELCREITVGFVGPMATEYTENGIPFLRSQNIQPFRLELSSIKFISPEFHKKLKKSALYPGDVVVVRTGYPGTACVIPPKLPVSNCADLVIFRPSSQLDPHYLTYMFNSNLGRSRVAGNLVGVAQQHFNIGVAKEMVIKIPSLTTQRKIAAILSAYDDLIENNTRRIAILEEMAQSLYREWFVHFRFPGHEKKRLVESELGLIPEGWEVVKLGDIAQEVRRGVNPESIDPETPYIGLEHLPRKSIALSEWGNANEVQSTKLIFMKGEILFGKIRPYFHKVGVAPIDGVCSTDTIVIVPRAEEYFAISLCCVSSDEFVNHATQTSQGTKMPRANWDVLMRYPIVLAPSPILNRFNEVLQGIVLQIQNLIFQNQNLRKTRDLLLPKLISGEVKRLDADIEEGSYESSGEPMPSVS